MGHVPYLVVPRATIVLAAPLCRTTPPRAQWTRSLAGRVSNPAISDVYALTQNFPISGGIVTQ